MKKLFLSVLVVLSGSFAHASFSLDQLSDADLEDAIKDFGANFVHTSVSPASALGNIFGFELGLVAGVSKTPELERISKNVDPAADPITALPHLALFGALTFPLGITAELGLLPTYEGDDAEIGSKSLAVKWTYSSLFASPVDLSVKLHAARSSAEFVQDNPAPDTHVKYEAVTKGLLFQVSKSLLLVEPYFSGGFVSVDGDLSANNSIFPDSSLKKSADVKGTQFMLGMNLNLMFFKLGLEVGRIFENNTANLKTSFYF
jgi:hypothetical protein